MRKLSLLFSCVILSLCVGCDLQPKITSLPDTVGEFISSRYPALLADPNAQPEIYNSAASDYGVYASPQLYGSVGTDEYVTYASVNDYIVPPQNDVAGDSALYGAPIAHAATAQTPDETPADDIVADTPTNDYLVVPEYARSVPTVPVSDTEITVARGDTLYSLAQQYASTPQELAHKNNLDMSAPLRIGQKLKLAQSAESPRAATPVAPDQAATKSVAPAVATTTRVQLTEIAVAPGDTLFSLSRRYSVPVNDLAVMNNIAAPFTLSVGQKLKVPNLSSAPVRAAADVATGAVATTTTPVTKVAPAGTGHAQVANASAPAATTTAAAKGTKTAPAPTTTTKKSEPKVATPKQKISSDPSKKLPTIAARSSSKFSWPVRGTILSHYGAKSGGLFNDGINIGASRGTAVNAAENGVVAYAGNEVKGMGNLVIIQHSGGWMTVYAHMDSMSVRRGARVSVGQKIGTVGATGKVDRPQLHFEIRKGTKAYNPASYLRS